MPTQTTLEKHIDEKKVLAVDFQHDGAIVGGASLVDNLKKVFEERGSADLTIDSITVSGTQVRATVSGGVIPAGENAKFYWLEVGADTNDGQHLEDSVRLKVYK